MSGSQVPGGLAVGTAGTLWAAGGEVGDPRA